MNSDGLAGRFEADRPRLRGMAYRLLGSASEADDAVQETWLRLSRTDAADIASLSAWLTTVVGHVCLDMLRARRSRREEPLAADGDSIASVADAEQDTLLAESVGQAMPVVLDRMAPAERVAFVLHDVFGVPFGELAIIVARSPAAARQLASRGRRKVRDAHADGPTAGDRHRTVVEAFFRASRAGDFRALLSVLDPDAVLRVDAAALRMGARNGWITSELHGAEAVAKQFAGQAQAAQPAFIDGALGAVWAPGGRPIVAFAFQVRGDRIVGIELVADADRLSRLAVEILP